ncbi:MAG: hypothetical protein E4G90_07640 [Gemmatimonadales bacterium]|nr:MAG: hypothetical protein E4G90_07640 [Gemmatimonadales bacterium]
MSWKQRSIGVLVFAAIVGCSDSTGVEIADLTGTWNATVVEFTNPANTAVKFELINEGGSLSLVVAANGDYTLNVLFPGDPVEVQQGTIGIVGNVLTLSETGQGSPTDFVFTLSGNTLTLTTNDVEFDFDDDGTDEPASLRIVFQRQ